MAKPTARQKAGCHGPDEDKRASLWKARWSGIESDYDISQNTPQEGLGNYKLGNRILNRLITLHPAIYIRPDRDPVQRQLTRQRNTQRMPYNRPTKAKPKSSTLVGDIVIEISRINTNSHKQDVGYYASRGPNLYKISRLHLAKHEPSSCVLT